MKILNVNQIREADQYTIKNEPVASIDLMERASKVFTHWFIPKFKKKRTVKIFCGIGNNGGDGLAVGRLLHEKGYPVSVYIVRYSENSSEDFKVNEDRLKKIQDVPINDIQKGDSFPEINPKDIIIDAMWGSGLSRPIEGFAAGLIEYLNNTSAIRVAIDTPSGLYADIYSDSIKFHADYTLSFELPKLSFLFPENYPYVGEWEARSIGLAQSFIEEAKTDNYYLSHDVIKSLVRQKRKFDHKGTNGHALIVAGSYGKMGAAVLSARGCLKAGAGLLTVHIPKCGYEIMQTNFPEAMVLTDTAQREISSVEHIDRYTTLGIGPGLSMKKETANAVQSILKSAKKPIVIDADALNILGENKVWLNDIPAESILTPHPKEFERLFGASENQYKRHQLQKESAKRHHIYIVLKGAHTAIACPDGETWFNSTGNPGMATAGMGDVLTGMIAGMLAQGYGSKTGSLLGVYLHGLAGDLAAKHLSQPSLIASDLLNSVDRAYRKVLN